MCMCVRALPQIENTAPKAAGLRGDCCLCRKMPSGWETVRRAFGYLFIDGQSGAIAPTSLGVQIVSAVIRSIGWGLLAALIHSVVGDAIEYGH